MASLLFPWIFPRWIAFCRRNSFQIPYPTVLFRTWTNNILIFDSVTTTCNYSIWGHIRSKTALSSRKTMPVVTKYVLILFRPGIKVKDQTFPKQSRCFQKRGNGEGKILLKSWKYKSFRRHFFFIVLQYKLFCHIIHIARNYRHHELESAGNQIQHWCPLSHPWWP